MDHSLTIVRDIEASAEAVYDALTNPVTMRRWMGKSVEANVRIGGLYRIEIDAGPITFVHTGEFIELELNRKVVRTLLAGPISEDHGEPEESPDFQDEVVEIRLKPIGPNQTQLVFIDSWNGNELNDEAEEAATAAWDSWLDQLDRLVSQESLLGNSDNQSAVRFERLLPGPIERIWNYLTDSELRGKWLATGEVESQVGGRIDHAFRHGELSTNSEPAPEKYRHMENGHAFSGRITRYEPPYALSSTWGGGWDDGLSEYDLSFVTFELSDLTDGVLLVVTHLGLDHRDERVIVAAGWHTHLAILEDSLRGKTPRPFWSTFTKLHEQYEARFLPEPAKPKIVMINGAFGVGKTTLANALLEENPDWLLFDPEEVGAMLWKVCPEPRGDFQDLAAWAPLVVETARTLIKVYDRTLVVPMTLVLEDNFETIRKGFQKIAPTHHFALVAPDKTIVQRLIERGDAEGTWGHQQIDRCVSALEGSKFRTHLDAEKTVAELAEEIQNAIGR